MLGPFPVLSITPVIYATYAWAFSCFIHNPCHIRNLCLGLFLFYPIARSYKLLILGLFTVLSITPVIYATYTWTFSCFIHNHCHIRNLCLGFFLFYPKPLSYMRLMLGPFPVLSITTVIYATYAWAFSCFIQNPCHICDLCLDLFLFYP